MICASPAIAGHKSRPQEQPSQPGAFVKFEAIALGPHGEPVTDLRSSECQVSEDGKREEIAFFRYDGNRRSETTPTGPHEFSNRDWLTVHPTIILLDLLSERLLTWGQAGEELVKALGSVESGNGLYLYVLTSQGAFYPVHALPETEAKLREGNPDWTQQIRSLFDVVGREFAGFRPIDDRDPAWRAQLTLQALGQFASYVAAMPGRKNLVWITHGVPSAVPGISDADLIDLTPQLRQLGETFAQANIALYTVAQAASGVRASMGYSFETLQLLSGLTGGRAYGSDSVGRAIAEAMADARGSYVVGYHPRRQKEDGKYHKLRVTCARKGVRLQMKQGYWAFPGQSSPEEQERAAVEGAAVSPFDDSGIGLRATVSPLDKPPGTVRFQIRIDSADLLLADRNDHYQGQLVLGLVTYSTDGLVQHIATTPFPLSLAEEQVNQAAKHGIEITQDLALDGTTQKIRVVIFDRGSNLTGSVTIPAAAAGANPERPSQKDDGRQFSEH
jgi:VWFA-related protein